MNCDNRKELMMKIQQMQFVALELQLYLDTHCDDEDALHDYNCAMETLDKCMMEYTEAYGSLMMLGCHSKDKWTWVDEPWPWEM